MEALEATVDSKVRRCYRTMSNESKLSLKDKIALVAAVIAVFTSVLALGRDYILGNTFSAHQSSEWTRPKASYGQTFSS